jgi:hypothetical protein
MKVKEQEDFFQLNDSDILDEFNKGKFVLINANKSDAIFNGIYIYIRNRKALVDEMIFGQRNRLALQVTYIFDSNGQK